MADGTTPPASAREDLASIADTGAARSGLGFLKGLIISPFNVVAGGAKGVVGSIFSRFGILTMLVTAGAMMFAPGLVRGVLLAIGREDLIDDLINRSREGGAPAILGTALLTGAGIAGAVGGVRGMVEGASESFSPASDSGEESAGISVGGVVGGLLAIAAVSAVAIGALSRSDEVTVAGDEGDPTVPPATPPVAPPGEALAGGRGGAIASLQ